MSTPTPGNKPTPRPAAAFTPSASSPSRSAASPAAHFAAQKAGKSPYKVPHGTHLASGAGHTPTGQAGMHTPTAHGLGTSSPSVAPGSGRSGTHTGRRSEANTPALSGLAGLGLYGAGVGTPGLDGAIDDMAAGSGTGIAGGSASATAQMASLGAGGAGTLSSDPTAVLDAMTVGGAVVGTNAGLTAAELFSTRLRAVADVLAVRWGRVSQEAVVAVVPRLGLEGMWEDSGRDDETRAGRSRNYIVAGKSFSVEIDWYEGRVRAVVLDLPDAKGAAAKRSLGRAAEILRKDLVGWDGEAAAGRYVDLAPFAANLERMARTDRLGNEGVGCFAALEGLAAGLDRVWQWEMGRQEGVPDDVRLRKGAELAVLCERSGRPAMHANRTIGLKLDYWLDRRRAFLRTYAATSATPAAADERWGCLDRLWSLLLDVEAVAAGTYAPVRISDDWVSADTVGKTSTEGGFVNPAAEINWEEPAHEPHDPMDLDAPRSQSVRFVARFNPPLVVPYATAAQIFELVGQPLGPEPLQNYLALLFPGKAPEAGSAPVHDEFVLAFDRTVCSVRNGRTARHGLRYRLVAPAHLAGRVLSEVPFAHPRELVTLLPFIRQWAFVGQLLRRSVGALDGPEDMEAEAEPRRPESPASDTDSDDEPPPPKKPAQSFDLILSAETPARVDLDCVPLYGQRRAAVRVLPNAEVVVEMEDQADAEEAGETKEIDAIQRVLRLSEDLGTVAAWMQERFRERFEAGE